MSDMGQHEFTPVPRRDRFLWAAAGIAACTMLEVWGSWLQIGAVSGFPRFGPVTTGWILPVSTEAYWSCALLAWLASPAGERSRRFAMWSGAAMFLLSLGGQELAHLLAAGHRAPSAWVVAFVSALPLVSLALVAVLVHLRHADREAAAVAQRLAGETARQAAAERAEAGELAALRRELADLQASLSARLEDASASHEAEASALRSELEATRTALESARSETAGAIAKADALTRKLEAASAQKKRAKAAVSARPGGASAQDSDPTNELRAVMELRADPDLRRPRMGGELARRLGIGASTGRRLHGVLIEAGEFTEYAQSLIGSLSERSQ